METFSIVKRGYNPEEVNAYISTLEQVIKSYKDKDNAIKNAIISAQVAADNVIKNAHLQAAEYKRQILKQLKSVRESVELQRKKLQDFQYDYNRMVQKYLTDVNTNDFVILNEQLDEMEHLIDRLNEMDELNNDI